MPDDPIVSKAIIDNVLDTYGLYPFVTPDGVLGIMFGTMNTGVQWTDASLIDHLQDWLGGQVSTARVMTPRERERLMIYKNSLSSTIMMINDIMQRAGKR